MHLSCRWVLSALILCAAILAEKIRRLKTPGESPCLFRRCRGNLDRDTRDHYFYVAFVTTQQFRMTSVNNRD
jgi:hypothetical protein